MNGKRKLHLPLKYLFVLPAMLLNVVFWEYPKVCVNLQTDVR